MRQLEVVPGLGVGPRSPGPRGARGTRLCSGGHALDARASGDAGASPARANLHPLPG
ncbi:hypothetical protein FM106_15775 [Brachybacterium faecium]|nr:hypothetical protein FM106_15775 [Brachybacterium faecium]